MRSFLGLANYYRKFIPDFATIRAPLTDLTKKGMPSKVVWGPAQLCGDQLSRVGTSSDMWGPAPDPLLHHYFLVTSS